MRVLIVDKLSQDTERRLQAAGCAVEVAVGTQGDSLVDKLRDSDPDVLVVRSTRVEARHLEAARSLSLVLRAGAGVNTIDLATASARGVYVSNCPGKNAIAVAELAMGHLVNLDRRIADNVADLRAHAWNKGRYSKARGLYGRTLAVLGVGDIGVETIRRAKAFGMRVRAWSRSLTPGRAAELGVTLAATPLEACRGADALTVHLALTADTRGLVDRKLLEALAPGAYVVNTSRGEIMDQEALVEAIRTRGLRAGLDVFASEPAGSAGEFLDPIADMPEVYGTHHIGASTEQASEAVSDEVVRIVETYLRTGRVPNVVNLAARSPATHVLVVRHADRVGVLAGVLGLLREAGVNVQEMENIIFQGAQAATARIQVDTRLGRDLLSRIEASPDVIAASLVALEP